MNRFITKIFVSLFAITLWNVGFYVPLTSYFGGEVTIAEANHQRGGGVRGNRGNGRGNGGGGVNQGGGGRGNGGVRGGGRGNRGGRGGGRGGGRCRRNPSRCQPPTVSELPIQYMVASGAATIALSGGMVFYIRKRKMKNSLEA